MLPSLLNDKIEETEVNLTDIDEKGEEIDAKAILNNEIKEKETFFDVAFKVKSAQSVVN
jgi:hypothetical protein